MIMKSKASLLFDVIVLHSAIVSRLIGSLEEKVKRLKRQLVSYINYCYNTLSFSIRVLVKKIVRLKRDL